MWLLVLYLVTGPLLQVEVLDYYYEKQACFDAGNALFSRVPDMAGFDCIRQD